MEKGGIPDLVPKIERYDHYVIKYYTIVMSISTQECKKHEFLFVRAFSNPIPVERQKLIWVISAQHTPLPFLWGWD